MISSILPALLLIGAVVFIHELGHYLAARSIGVKVEKFSVCFGPRIFAPQPLGVLRGHKILHPSLSGCWGATKFCTPDSGGAREVLPRFYQGFTY